MRTVAAIVLMALVQTPAAPAPHLVIDARTQSPIAFARVLLAKSDTPLAESIVMETDERGRFLVTGISSGTYRVFAEHDDYLRAWLPHSISVAAGQPVPPISIALTPSAVIAGRVSYEDGEPAAKVFIRAHAVTAAGPAAESVAQGRTNDLGEYRLIGLPPGTYAVSAEPYTRPSIGPVELGSGRPGPPGLYYIVPTPPCPDCRGEGRGMQPLPALLSAGGFIDPAALTGVSYPRVYFPGTTDAAQAKGVTVAAGARLEGIDIRLVTRERPR